VPWMTCIPILRDIVFGVQTLILYRIWANGNLAAQRGPQVTFIHSTMFWQTQVLTHRLIRGVKGLCRSDINWISPDFIKHRRSAEHPILGIEDTGHPAPIDSSTQLTTSHSTQSNHFCSSNSILNITWAPNRGTFRHKKLPSSVTSRHSTDKPSYHSSI